VFENSAHSAGTAAGTVIDNVATVSFDLGGISSTLDSNTVTLQVLERLDVDVTLQSPQLIVAPGDTARSLLFTLTNTGNGEDQFLLAIDSAVAGDDFDPLPDTPAIYFDSDASGDFSVGDEPYVAGSNDPVLAADSSVQILILNSIPDATSDAQLGRSSLLVESTTGTGAPGETLTGAGDGGLDAVLGASGGAASATGEYRVADVELLIQKSVTAMDPDGGPEPRVGATLTYSIDVAVQNDSTATASVLSDAIPVNTTYVANSMTLNGAGLSDAADADAGEFQPAGTPTVIFQLGDLTQADGTQSLQFQVTIN